MGLFSPIWKTTKQKKVPNAMEFVNRTDDVQTLVDISQGASMAQIKEAASQRLVQAADCMDADSVRFVLKSMKSDEFKRSFIMNIKDTEILKKLCRECCYYSRDIVRYTADEDVLKDAFLNTPYVKQTLDRIKDRKFITDVVKNHDYDPKVRIISIKTIDDEELIFDIACNDPDISVRRAAVDMISDPQKMDIVVEKAYERAQKLSGMGVVPKEEYCAYEFKHRDLVYCTVYDSSRLRYVTVYDNKPIARISEVMWGEYTPSVTVTGVSLRKRNGVSGYYFEYPDVKVELTDEPVEDDDIFVCPVCYHAKPKEQIRNVRNAAADTMP